MPRKGENIYKRKDGRWEGRYIKARSKTGKAVYGYVYAPTYKEAKRKRSQAIINIEANQTTICKVSETTMPTCFIRKLANDWMNIPTDFLCFSSCGADIIFGYYQTVYYIFDTDGCNNIFK